MAGPLLYSTNPWFASEVAVKYRGGRHVAWVCDCFDITTTPSGSASALTGPTSNPRELYDRLFEEYAREDKHSDTIKRYKRTFKNLAKDWFSNGEINVDQRDEIIASVTERSWLIWRPVLYIIPRKPIEDAGRLLQIPRPGRAAYGPEMRIDDLQRAEFDIVELRRR